jgi:hypothetical protein
VPQLAPSVWLSTHCRKQTLSFGGGQLQTPATQVDPATQAMPQSPHASGSDWRLRHTPPQSVSPCPHVVELLVHAATTPAATSATTQPQRATTLAHETAIGRLLW